jgi:hypothetical protein
MGWHCVIGPRFRLSGQARRHREGAVVRWRRSLSAGHAAGAGHFVGAQATSRTASLSRVQLSMLLEGIDWIAPIRTVEPDDRFKCFLQYSRSFGSFSDPRFMATSFMPSASLPDLDSLDLEAVKALLIDQHEKYTITLNLRTREIERLVLLVEKL